MSNIDKQALREIAEQTKIAGEAPVMPFEQRINALNDFMKHFTPATVLALLDELEVKDSRVGELEAIATDYALKFQRTQDALKHQALLHKSQMEAAEKRIAELEAHPYLPQPLNIKDEYQNYEYVSGWNDCRNAASVREHTAAIRDVIAERYRQQSVEGWTPEHDDEHMHCEMAVAAACYIMADDDPRADIPELWPWPEEWWKPTTIRRDLVKAGALVLAEIERIDRAAGIGKGE